MAVLALAFILLGASWSTAWAADPPCDKYPIVIQTKCEAIWKSLYQEDGPVIAQFGLDQQKRREEAAAARGAQGVRLGRQGEPAAAH